jgi:putative protease
MTQIELLAPAKNLAFGIAAINCGADAVYIGSPKFGARSAAGNSIAAIAELANYAHQFRAKVYVALNTLLFDTELNEAQSIIHQVWNAGADALIIQDMGICELNLPPIPLFASTQTHNINFEKVLFFEKVGFQRVILARELSFSEILAIRKKTTIDLESFVHGAICVCYSGQCNLSHAITGRSGNRGECAQLCRWNYSLKNKNGQQLERNKYLLSLKDLNLSDSLEKLIDSGITSFKIEGRLKDLSYVKNVTGFYRQKLDVILEGRQNSIERSSVGKTYFNFNPDLEITFNRGYSGYFSNGRIKNLASFATQKSMGKSFGIVKQVNKNTIEIETDELISNGDGFCFINNSKELRGFRANKAGGKLIFPNEMPEIKIGTQVFRNHNQQFESQLEGKQTDRKVEIIIELTVLDKGINIKAMDEEGLTAALVYPSVIVEAKNQAAAMENLKTGLSKTGNSIYKVKGIVINSDKSFFLPNAQINEMKRFILKAMDDERISKYKRTNSIWKKNNFPYPQKELDFSGNVTNKLAEKFYNRHGTKVIEKGFELLKYIKSKKLMTTKYCLKFEMNACPKENKKVDKFWDSGIYLENSETRLNLIFDCKNCEMIVKAES